MAIHLTPTELGREAGMHRREVITKCMELGVPIFQGRIDKTLFLDIAEGRAAPRGRHAAREGVAPHLSSLRRIDSADQADSEERAMEAVTAAVLGHRLEDDGGSGRAGRREARGTRPRCGTRSATSGSDVSYDELGTRRQRDRPRPDRPRPRARRQGLDPLPHTRPEWTYANLAILAAGTVSVSIYQTNSAEECHYVLQHSESKAVFVEDAEQLAKVREVQGDLPNLEHIVIFDPSGDVGDAVSLDDLRERGAAREAAELEERTNAVTKDDICITIYTSGTTGPPKGCLISHGNYRDVTSMTESMGVLEEDEVVYLFLPLAHAFAKLIQFITLDLGGTLAYWEKDPQKIIPNLMETKPTYFPSVPRMFEKIYTLATSATRPTRSSSSRRCRWA